MSVCYSFVSSVLSLSLFGLPLCSEFFVLASLRAEMKKFKWGMNSEGAEMEEDGKLGRKCATAKKGERS